MWPPIEDSTSIYYTGAALRIVSCIGAGIWDQHSPKTRRQIAEFWMKIRKRPKFYLFCAVIVSVEAGNKRRSKLDSNYLWKRVLMMLTSSTDGQWGQNPKSVFFEISVTNDVGKLAILLVIWNWKSDSELLEKKTNKRNFSNICEKNFYIFHL